MAGSNHAQRLIDLLRERRLLRARDVRNAGIPRVYLTRLARQGIIRRVSRGLYELSDAPADEQATLAEVCARIPKATLCLLSAAQFHGLTTASPPAVWIMLPSHTPHPTVDLVRLEIVYANPELLTGDAIERHDHYGATIRVTSATRTVADMFRYRNRVGLELALETLRTYAERTHTFSDLQHHAKRLRIHNVIAPYLEALSP